MTSRKELLDATTATPRPVLVTTAHRGVFFGYTTDPATAPLQTLTRCRMAVYWSADVKGVLSPCGRFVAIEVKTKTGRVRPEQKAWLEEMRGLGAVAGVVRSVDEAIELIGAALRGEVTP